MKLTHTTTTASIDTSRQDVNSSTSFDDWYDSLPVAEQNRVDDLADELGTPLYDEADDMELSYLKDAYEMRKGVTGSQSTMSTEVSASDTGEYDGDILDEDYNPKHGIFTVTSFGNDFNELQKMKRFTEPKQAILYWVQLQNRYPLDVMITGFQEEEEKLRSYVTDHQDWYRAISEKFKCPYDPEYIINECEKPVSPRKGQYADIYPDQCHPFGLG